MKSFYSLPLRRLPESLASDRWKSDCAALTEPAEAELFGQEGGGSLRRRPGRLEAAHRGISYLSEVEALSPPLQAKLVRVLETKALMSPNSHDVRSLDVRVIASTRIDLGASARSGGFRQDLFHALAIGVLNIPPLRQRREDIPVLYQHFYNDWMRPRNANTVMVDESARRHLSTYDWPGNVRELMHYAQRVAVGLDENDARAAQTGQTSTTSLPDRVSAFEADLIGEALAHTAGDVRSTLTLLGIPKKTFYDKPARHSIHIDSYRK